MLLASTAGLSSRAMLYRLLRGDRRPKDAHRRFRDLDTEVEVSDGVRRGDRGILNPPVDLDDSSKVQVRASPTAKAAS
jgi:hypothetical protein